MREKEAANKSLAISVLGGLSRVGSLARSETVLSRLHALAQVAQQGGLSSDAALSPQVHDLKAVGDALEALGNVAAGDDEVSGGGRWSVPGIFCTQCKPSPFCISPSHAY